MSISRFALASVLAFLALPAFATAPDFSTLTLNLDGVATAGIAIGVVMMGALGVFWGVKRIMSLVG